MRFFTAKNVIELLDWLPKSKWHWGGLNGIWNSREDNPYNGYKSKDVLDNYLNGKNVQTNVFEALLPLVAKLNKMSYPSTDPKFLLVQTSNGDKTTEIVIEVTNLPGYFNITDCRDRIAKAILDLELSENKIRLTNSSDENNSIVNEKFDVNFYKGKMSKNTPSSTTSGF